MRQLVHMYLVVQPAVDQIPIQISVLLLVIMIPHINMVVFSETPPMVTLRYLRATCPNLMKAHLLIPPTLPLP
jgi:hypothetical protein